MTQANSTARASRRADGHFTTIANAALRDPRLSWKAKGILAGALSHGPGFRFNREWFVRNSTDGGTAVRTGLEELRQLGYLATERIVGQNGQFLPGGLHFCDDPSLLQELEASGGDPDGGKTCGGKSTIGKTDHIRRSIERRPIEEHQEDLDTPYPASGERTDMLSPRELGTNPRARGTNPRATGSSPRALGTNPRAVELATANAREPFRGGTLAEDPHPQRPDPAPSPPKPTRMAKPKPFVPSPDDIPASLLPVEAPLRAFWQVKAGQTTQQAWNCLTGALERIWRHPDGGTDAVRDQLEAATQAGWRSITFANWQKYSQQPGPSPIHARPAAGPRRSATDQAADNVLAMFAARGIG